KSSSCLPYAVRPVRRWAPADVASLALGAEPIEPRPMPKNDAERYRMSADLAEEQARRAKNREDQQAWEKIAAGYRLLALRASPRRASLFNGVEPEAGASAD